MALRLIEGFEGWSNPESFYFQQGSSSFVVASGEGRFGGKALKNNLGGGGEHVVLLASFPNAIQFAVPNSVSAVVGFAYKFSPGGKDTTVMRWQGQFLDGALYDQVVLRKDQNDILCLVCNGVNIARGTHPLQSNRYYFIEWKVTLLQHLNDLGPSGQQWALNGCAANSNVIRLDGVVEATVTAGTAVGYTGYTTAGNPVNGGYAYPGTSRINAALWNFTRLRLEYDQFQLHQWFDDVYALDATGTDNADFLNDCAIDILTVNGEGAASQWTPVGAATPHEAVFERPPDGDTTYVWTNTTGRPQTFTTPAMKANSVAVFGVQATAILRKTDIAPRTVAFVGSAPSGIASTAGMVVATTTGLVALYNCDEATAAAAAIAFVGGYNATYSGGSAFTGHNGGIDGFAIVTPSATPAGSPPPYTKDTTPHGAFSYTGSGINLGAAGTIELWFAPAEFGDPSRTDSGVNTPKTTYPILRLEQSGVGAIEFVAWSTNDGDPAMTASFTPAGDLTHYSDPYYAAGGAFCIGADGFQSYTNYYPPCVVNRVYHLALAWDATGYSTYADGKRIDFGSAHPPSFTAANFAFGGCGGKYDLISITARRIGDTEIAARWAAGNPYNPTSGGQFPAVLTDTYAEFVTIWDRNFAADAAWTAATVNTLEAGVQLVKS